MQKKILIQLIVLSVLLQILAFLSVYFVPQKFYSPTVFFQVPFFFSVSFIVIRYLLIKIKGNPNAFIRAFMMATFLRFLFYVILITAYVFSFKSDAVNFLILFLLFFIIYLIFDVYMLLKGIKDK